MGTVFAPLSPAGCYVAYFSSGLFYTTVNRCLHVQSAKRQAPCCHLGSV